MKPTKTIAPSLKQSISKVLGDNLFGMSVNTNQKLIDKAKEQTVEFLDQHDPNGWTRGPFMDYTLTKEDYELIKKHNFTPFNRRAKLDTGKFCNKKCSFCYYYSQLDHKDFLSIDNAKKIVEWLLSKGIRDIEFSGGEPCVHPKFKELTETVYTILKEKENRTGIEHNLSLVTNGSIDISDNQYFHDVLVSVHGYGDLHNSIVDPNKTNSNAFDKIDLLLNADTKFIKRINIVITPQLSQTIQSLQSDEDPFYNWIIDLIKRDKIKQINLLPMNFWSDNVDNYLTEDEFINIHQYINVFTEKLNSDSKFIWNFFGTKLKGAHPFNIRYTPNCLMSPVSMMHTRSHLDHFFDKYDWNKVHYPQDADIKLDPKILSEGDALKLYTLYDYNLDKIENELLESFGTSDTNNTNPTNKLKMIPYRSVYKLAQQESHFLDATCITCTRVSDSHKAGSQGSYCSQCDGMKYFTDTTDFNFMKLNKFKDNYIKKNYTPKH